MYSAVSLQTRENRLNIDSLVVIETILCTVHGYLVRAVNRTGRGVFIGCEGRFSTRPVMSVS